MEAADVIQTLGLIKHPREGGWFKETYRSKESISSDCLPAKYSGERAFSTQIFYLITPTEYSRFHRVLSDGIFHFYMGARATLSILSPVGQLEEITLGHDLASGEQLQATVPAEYWQGVYLPDNAKWALLGATVAPGFEYADFSEPKRSELLQLCPHH